MNRKYFTSSAFILICSMILGACAAQNAHSIYRDADEAVKEAMAQAGPQDSNANKAFDALNKGKLSLMDARYDEAIKSFREAMRYSREVHEAKLKPIPKGESKPTNVHEASQKEALSAASQATKELASSPAADSDSKTLVVPPAATKFPEPKPVEVKVQMSPEPELQASPVTQGLQEKKGLPKEALAKYLASKKAAPKPAPKPSTLEAGPAEAAKKDKMEKPEKPEAIALSDEPKEEVHMETADQKPIPTSAVIEAPATPSLKPVPKLEPKVEDKKDEVMAKASALLAGGAAAGGAAAEAKAGESKKTKDGKQKIPGTIVFIENDPSIVTEAMTVLNQTAKYLLENPSLSLVLQGHLTNSEAKTLIQARFESMKAYLIGKGVPEDQIMLDSDQKRGKNPEFTMYVIEH